MTAAYFEDHPTDPEKVILRKPPLDQGADYERGFIDGMQKPKIGCVNHDCDQCKAQRTWVGLTISERDECWRFSRTAEDAMEAVEAKLKEKNT